MDNLPCFKVSVIDKMVPEKIKRIGYRNGKNE